MKESEVIDVESSQREEAEVEQKPTMALARSTPLDVPVQQFKDGLERRGENRKALIDWIRSSLVEGVDFGKIHVVSKSKCSLGRNCKNPNHFSKPTLYKPGAEKICGMLGLNVEFPTLKDYEQAAIDGKDIKNVLLRCELVSNGQVVAHGVGARNVASDYGDLNKSLKMAEKSGHIDATLRVGGLSEIFTQDLDQMAADGALDGDPPRDTRPPPKAPQTKPQEQPEATQEQYQKFMKELEKVREPATALFKKMGWIPDTANAVMEEVPLKHVPKSQARFKWVMGKIQEIMDGGDPDVPAGEFGDDAEAWREFVVPFGKHKDKKLGDLETKTIWGFWNGFEVETEWNGKPKKKETIARDQAFRDALDAAGEHYEFGKGQ